MNNNEKQGYSKEDWIYFLDKASSRIENNHSYKDYEKYLRDTVQKFAMEYSDDLERSLEEYREAVSPRFAADHYRDVPNYKVLEQYITDCKIMVLTANPVEKAIFHYKMCEESNNHIWRFIGEKAAFYFLNWGKYHVIHVHQTETGAYKNLGTDAAIYEALKYCIPNVIISLGIAFGIDCEKQHIGDVIVSRRILPYSENKRDEEKVKPDRSQDKMIDDWLHVRLANAHGFLDNVTYGDILSGGSVMSSFREKDKICSGYSKADFIIGGEMEGDAVLKYSKYEGIPGVVIKGICDWGVAKNNIYPHEPEMEEELKVKLQAYAMANAIEKCSPLMNDSGLFSRPKNSGVNDWLDNHRKIIRISMFLLACEIPLTCLLLFFVTDDHLRSVIFLTITCLTLFWSELVLFWEIGIHRFMMRKSKKWYSKEYSQPYRKDKS